MRHFQMLEKSGKAIGSCWQDYSNLINCELLDSLGSAVFSRIGFLRRSEHSVPFMLFIGEDLSERRFGLYCSLTMRYPEIVCPLLGLEDSDQGFRSNASTYAHLMFFDELRTQGYQEVHLGGSETADLNRFKRRLGARSAQSYWVVSDSR